MLDLHSATAAELDALPQLKGHGFEIVRYREERGRFTECASSRRCPDWQASGTERKPVYASDRG